MNNTPRSSAISGMLVMSPRYLKEDVLDATLMPLTLTREFRISSEIPSEKNNWSGSPDMLAKGSTAIDRFCDAVFSDGDSCQTNLSMAKSAKATDKIPMMTKSSFRPVFVVTDDERSTSRSNFSPSGVSSNAQAKINATGRPLASKSRNDFATQSGASITGMTTSTTCSNSHEATA